MCFRKKRGRACSTAGVNQGSSADFTETRLGIWPMKQNADEPLATGELLDENIIFCLLVLELRTPLKY